MASTTYLQVDYSTGKLYEYSKEVKQGFEVQEVNGEVKGFRRYLDYGLTAIYKGVELRQSPIGDQLSLKFQEGIDWVQISVNAYTQRDSFTDFAESVIRVLPALVMGQAYRVYPYVMETEAGYTNRGVSFRENDKDGEKVKPVLYYQKAGETSDDPNAIPPLVWKEKLGKNKPTATSIEEQTDFFYRHLTEAIALTSDGTPANSGNGTPTYGGNGTSAKKEAPATTFPTTENKSGGDPFADDDLPF